MGAMTADFLSLFMGDPVCARVLRAFTFAPTEPFTLAQVVRRAGVSAGAATRAVRVLEKLDILRVGKVLPASRSARRIPKGKIGAPSRRPQSMWMFNADFRHARALAVFVHEVSPVRYEKLLAAIKRAGKVNVVIASGAFMGDPGRPIELLVAGDTLSDARLDAAVRAFEPQVGREIRYANLSTPEFRYRLTIQDRLLRETLDFPHLVLLDKHKLL